VAIRLHSIARLRRKATAPRSSYHLGDVVYNFGEAQYYYDQFYEPFRNYPAPIFAIPGNHDSFVFQERRRPHAAGHVPAKFLFQATCHYAEAGSLHRTAMTQPGVYFTLDAPFVRIIGLFSNALEDPGVISNLDHKWDAVSNVQIDFLRAQLKRNQAGKLSGRRPARDAPPAVQLFASHEIGRRGWQSRLQPRHAPADR